MTNTNGKIIDQLISARKGGDLEVESNQFSFIEVQEWSLMRKLLKF